MMELELTPEVVEVKSLSFSNDDKLSPTVVYRTIDPEKEFQWLHGIHFWHQLSLLKKQCDTPYEIFVRAQNVWLIVLRLKLSYDRLTMDYDVKEDCYRIRPLVHKAPSQDIILKIRSRDGFDIDCVDRIPLLDKLVGAVPSPIEHYKYHYSVPTSALSGIGNLIGEIFSLIDRYDR